ncbi:MAG TPA: flagellar basal body P-ring formation chaperone FlgA [Arenibaculum sp.]|nr:flagellar basal body P-ring formation chaperone FlgA [Arenibaculum sp.]
MRIALAAPVRAAMLAVLTLMSGTAAANADLEEMLAAGVTDTFGPSALPAGARVAVTLAYPFEGPVEAIRDLDYDPASGQVRSLVLSGGRLYELTASTSVEIDVPVPVRRIPPGEILSEGDLTTVPMPLARMPASAIGSKDLLVGMASRRLLAPGRLIHARSVGAPVVVERNKPVTLVFEQDGLYLAAQGRALQDGGVGDEVRVMNPSSHAVVNGMVTGPQTVSVAP